MNKKIIGILVVINICVLSYLVIADLTTEHTRLFYDTFKSETITYEADGDAIVSYRFNRSNKVITLYGEDARNFINYDYETIDVVQVTYSESKLNPTGKLIFVYIVSWK